MGYDAVRLGGQRTLRAHFSTLLNNYETDGVIDFGTNEGRFDLSIRSLCLCRKIYSFEPIRAAYNKLNRLASQDQDWNVFNCALGAESEEKFVEVFDFSALPSLLQLNAYARNSSVGSEVIEKQQIDMKMLDDYVVGGMLDLRKIIFLKRDTQEFALESLKHASFTLNDIRCMPSDFSLKPL